MESDELCEKGRGIVGVYCVEGCGVGDEEWCGGRKREERKGVDICGKGGCVVDGVLW